MKELYETDADFRKYVDHYCLQRGIGKELAFTHSMIVAVAKYYKDKKADLIEENKRR